MMSTTETTIAEAINQLGLTMDVVFVPWSASRNKTEKQPSLNWIVTIKRNGRDVLTTDYMAGCGHCPSYAQGKKSVLVDEAIRGECETGLKHRVGSYGATPMRAEPILPPIADVLYSLVGDSDVIDYSGFADWADSLGYDTDSRKAETIYRACLEIALQLRGALGTDGLDQLRVAFQDY